MSIREKLAREGREVYTVTDLKHLSMTELLACLLRSERLAQVLAETYKTPRALAEAEMIDLTRVPGVSWGRAEQVKAGFELAARAAVPLATGLPTIRTPIEVFKFLEERFRGLKKEVFLALLLSTRNRVLRVETVSEGTLNTSIVHPREVFRQAILASTASVIVAHNHPSGDPEPSEDDLAITRRLLEAGEVIGIPLLDHVIVAGERFCSLKEEGHLS